MNKLGASELSFVRNVINYYLVVSDNQNQPDFYPHKSNNGDRSPREFITLEI